MSNTHTIYCDKCRVKHWAGQSDYLYDTAVTFLHEHIGHPIRFAIDGCEEDDDFNFKAIDYPARATPSPAQTDQKPIGYFSRNSGSTYTEVDPKYAGDADVIALYDRPSPAPIQQTQQDTARLDWLEQAAESLGGLMLHDGQHPAPGRNGLGLRFMGRTLRQAVDACMPTPAEVSAPAGAAKSGDTNPCGGCGERDPDKRCIGCMHDFLAPTVKAGQSDTHPSAKDDQ